MRQRKRVATISKTVTQKVSAWLGGQLMLSLIIGVTSAIGLWMMGVPYFVRCLRSSRPMGEMIPMVGPILAAIPAILVAATVSPGLAVGVAIFFIVQQQLENTILVPKIMGRQVGLSAVTVIIALGIGSQLARRGRRHSVGAHGGHRPGAFDELVARDARSYAVRSRCVMTWPLLPGIASDVPGDLGDSLLNMWILGWGAEHVPRVATGQLPLADFWNANIFHPEPLALSFSEHLFGQVLQILPIYHLTGNLILSYNLLFLSSFFLSALGMYLLVGRSAGRHAKRTTRSLRRRAALRIRPDAHRTSRSHPIGQLAMDAVRLVRLSAVSRGAGACVEPHTVEAARWWNGCAADAELVVRLLPDLLRAGRGCVCCPPDRVESARSRMACLGELRRRCSCGRSRDASVSGSAVSRGTARSRHRAAVWRSREVLSRRLQLLHGT